MGSSPIVRTLWYNVHMGSTSGRIVSEETKVKLSIARSKYLEEHGGGGYPDVKWWYASNIEGEEFIVRGLLERDIAELLNIENRLWIRKIYLPYYTSTGRLRMYAPDFYLPNENLYIEAKGFYSESDQNKMASVCEVNSIECISIVFKPWNKVDRSAYRQCVSAQANKSSKFLRGYTGQIVECVICGEGCQSHSYWHRRCLTCIDCGVPVTNLRCRKHAVLVKNTRASKIVWPSVENLVTMLNTSNYERVAQKLGVSSNAVRKHLRVRSIELPKAIYRVEDTNT